MEFVGAIFGGMLLSILFMLLAAKLAGWEQMR